MQHSETYDTNAEAPMENNLKPEKSQSSMILELLAERDYLPLPHVLMRLGGWAALFTAGAAFCGAWLAPYNVKVQVPAVIRPAGESQLEQLTKAVPAQQGALMINAWVPNGSINTVKRGQQVQMRVRGCPYPTYGVLEGEVNAIATDTVLPNLVLPNSIAAQAIATLEPASSGPSSQLLTSFQPGAAAGRYAITMQPNAVALASVDGQRCELRAGMEGQVDILLGQERLLSYLMRKARLGALL